MATEALLAAIEAAVGALQKVGADYALVGGAALPAWGRLRATQDADVLLALSPWKPSTTDACSRAACTSKLGAR